MLKGLQLAWFRVFSSSVSARQLALSIRKDNWAILKKDDHRALEYQYHDARADHAREHLSGPGLVLSWSSAEGDITERDQREWRSHRTEKKRRARSLLEPIWERREQEDLYPSPY